MSNKELQIDSSHHDHRSPSIKLQGRVIANFAWQHLKAATIFRDHLIKLESDNIGQPFGSFFVEIRSYGSACIMSAAASLEVLINELFIAHNSPLRNQLPDFDQDFWGENGIEMKRPLEKYQLALKMLDKPLFTKQEAPYRDALTLIRLRNALVHYKPTWDSERKRDVLIQALDGKFALSPFPGAGADFVSERCMSAGCARWVVSTCLALIDEFGSRTNLDPNKLAGFKKLGST
jgi:hypothetical protein